MVLLSNGMEKGTGTLHRPSSSGAAQRVDGSTASTIHANSKIGPVPGAAPWREIVLTSLLILSRKWVALVMHWPHAHHETLIMFHLPLPCPTRRAGTANAGSAGKEESQTTLGLLQACSGFCVGVVREAHITVCVLDLAIGAPSCTEWRAAEAWGPGGCAHGRGRWAFSSACSFSAKASSLISTAVQHSLFGTLDIGMCYQVSSKDGFGANCCKICILNVWEGAMKEQQMSCITAHRSKTRSIM